MVFVVFVVFVGGPTGGEAGGTDGGFGGADGVWRTVSRLCKSSPFIATWEIIPAIAPAERAIATKKTHIHIHTVSSVQFIHLVPNQKPLEYR